MQAHTFLIENRSLRLAGRSLASAGLPGDEFGGDELHVGRVRGVERRVDRAAGELGIGLRGGDEHRVDVALDEFVDAAALALRVASDRLMISARSRLDAAASSWSVNSAKYGFEKSGTMTPSVCVVPVLRARATELGW